MKKAVALSTVSSGAFTADLGGDIKSIRAAKGLTVAIGDTVLVDLVGASEWWAIAVGPASTPTQPFNPAPPPPTQAQPGSLICFPVETRTYRGGWRTDHTDLVQGVWEPSTFGNNTGCAFYGNKPRSISGATVTSATIRTRRSDGGWFAAQVTRLYLVTQKTRPSGAPTLGSDTAGPSLAVGASTTFAIPTSWAQAMVDGTAGGLAIFQSDSDPYVIWDGKGSWPEAMKLTINYTR